MRGCSCRGTSGFAHISCLAEQAKILVDEAEENNLGVKAENERHRRWYNCNLCKQDHHGVVACALGWACWKTYLGRPETDRLRCMALTELGSGLSQGGHHEDALAVKETELATKRRLGASERNILVVQNNLATTYHALGRLDEALSVRQEVYSGRLRLDGEERYMTLAAASNYAMSLVDLELFKEARLLMRKMTPVARRVLGENHDLTLQMRATYAQSLYEDPGATLDDLNEAVTTLEATARTARRVLGGAHPLTTTLEDDLQDARATRDALQE